MLKNLLNFLLGTEARVEHELFNVYDRYVKYVNGFEKSLFFFVKSLCKYLNVKNVEIKCSYSLFFKLNGLIKFISAHGVDYTFITVTPLVSHEDILKTILMFKYVRKLGYKVLEEYINILITAIEVWESVENVKRRYSLHEYVEEQLRKSKLIQIVDKLVSQYFEFSRTMYRKFCRDSQLRLINYIEITLLPTVEKYVKKHIDLLKKIHELCTIDKPKYAHDLLKKNWFEILLTMKFLDFDIFIESIDKDLEREECKDVIAVTSFLLERIEDKLNLIKQVVRERTRELREKVFK